MKSADNWISRIGAIKLGSWLGAILSLGVGVALHVTTSQAIENDARERFGHMARGVQSILDSRIKTYADLLRGTSSLFLTTEHVTREQFRQYVNGLDLARHFPGIETVNFARHLRESERAAFEAEMRQDLPGFRIMPPGHRAEYTVLTFIEPGQYWNGRIGMDLHARPAVALALAYSRDTGDPSTSGTAVRIQSTASGLGMRMPVYRANTPLTDVAQRRAAYIGSVGIGFSVQRLAQGVLDNMPKDATRLMISGMSPVEEPGGPPGVYRRRVFFDNHPGMETDERRVFHALLPVGVSGRGWDIDFSVKKRSLYSEIDSLLPWVAMLAGVTGTALLYALFQTLSSSRRRAIELAEEMTGELRGSEAKLQKTNDNLRRLAAHAETIKESERKRIAREIHDDLGQNLLALRIEVDLLASRTNERHPLLHARAQWMLEQIDATIKSVRQIINDLRPNVLDLGLTAAVDWQITEFQRRTGIPCELVSDNHDLHVSDRCATTLFRILQESLTNVSRHARATAVRVELALDPDAISMSVSDNGIGLKTGGGQKPGSFGLVGIEERVRILGGKCVITSRPGAGTTVHVSIPAADNLISVAYAPAPSSLAPNPALNSL
ncbi:histidine kinase [Massilia sp. Dwa41.01b]|uniref:CHASE domain-containing protein n=2 Tax=unclassified Massilia TaxID=2609279 RepID=UPI0016022D3B|nr:CHASE domain-containing protein [Massilia sp. Dwa41.01b]QNA90990.1 histidine kinase [Massilia sp. Dwa41.01b]QNB01376.1 histidine kinase [Massilia sp. Se16.2.3]